MHFSHMGPLRSASWGGRAEAAYLSSSSGWKGGGLATDMNTNQRQSDTTAASTSETFTIQIAVNHRAAEHLHPFASSPPADQTRRIRNQHSCRHLCLFPPPPPPLYPSERQQQEQQLPVVIPSKARHMKIYKYICLLFSLPLCWNWSTV